MYFAKTYVTKWHDTDADGVMRPSALLVYMQETANLQCREWGMDLDELYKNEGLGFLLARTAARIFAPLHAYEEIEVRTWCPVSKGYTFLRCFSVHRGGEMIALCLSHWALMDAREKKLVPCKAFEREFPTGDLPDESLLPARVRIPADTPLESAGTRRIVFSDLDFNRHMNNTKYPDMICDYLPDVTGKWVTSLSLSYLKEAAFGDDLTVLRAETSKDAYLVRTIREDGATCLEAAITLGDI